MDRIYELLFQVVIIFSFFTIGVAVITALDIGPTYIKNKISVILTRIKKTYNLKRSWQ